MEIKIHAVKIIFHDLKINFHIMKNKFKPVDKDFFIRS